MTIESTFDDDVKALESLVRAEQWPKARPLALRCVQALPGSHALNAWTAQIEYGLGSKDAAIHFAKAALDCGFGAREDCAVVAEILFWGGDYVRAMAASAVHLMVAGESPRLSNAASKTEAMQVLVRHIYAVKRAGCGDTHQLDALLCLALPGLGQFEDAYQATLLLGVGAFRWLTSDLACQLALLEIRTNRLESAANRLRSRSRRADPALSLAYLGLLEGSSSRPRAVETCSRAVSESEKLDDRDSYQSRYTRMVSYSSLAICHFLNDSGVPARHALEAIADVPIISNVRRVAHMLDAITSKDYANAISFALATTVWDGSGDFNLPYAQDAFLQLILLMDRQVHSLTEAQGLRRVRALLCEPRPEGPGARYPGELDENVEVWNQGTEATKSDDFSWWLPHEETLNGGLEGTRSGSPNEQNEIGLQWWV